MRFRFFSACAAACAAFAAASPASANGRFPESNAIFFHDADPNLVIMRVTFGAMISKDRGKTWRWVCERSIGVSGAEDPMYAVTPNGTLIASTFQGLAQSSDMACSFSFVKGPLADLVFVDLAQKPSDPKTIISFASSYEKQDADGGILFQSQLFETTNEGQAWTAVGQRFNPYMLGETVDYAASDPDRIYVSGVLDPGSAPKAVIFTSRDHGKNFEQHQVPLVDTERSVYIAAVDPKNADRVYFRTQNATDKPGRLLVSDDGAKTFRTVYTSQGGILGFALAPDGAKVFVGGPKDGVRVASTTDFAFQQKSNIEVQCLTLASDGLWACSNEKSGFVAGLSKDEGATFEAKLHFCDIQGALDCPAGTSTRDVCGPLWTQQRALLGCEPTAGDGGVEAGKDGGLDDEPPGGGGKSCKCSVVGESSPLTALLASVASLAGIVTFVARRRRR